MSTIPNPVATLSDVCVVTYDYREIPLTQGQVALVDEQDYLSLSQWRWHAWKHIGTGSFYAMRHISRKVNPKGGKILMHREILGVEKSLAVDHRNHNTLDNRRFNIRPATCAQNNYNKRIRKDNKSGVKGVFFDLAKSKWVAQINADRRHLYLGQFLTKELAYEAYCVAAKELHGEFANF